MTRIALLADIHGNLPALENVIDDMQQFAPDHVVVAGDSVNGSPFSSEVLQLITEKRWTVIRGNNEYYCINATTPRRPAAWAHYDLIPRLMEEVRDWRFFIAGLPDDALLLYPDAPDVYLCHARPGDCWTGIFPAQFEHDARVLEGVAAAKATTIFCAHTHIPLNRRVGQYHIINPGSVGVPLLGEQVASYMIVDGVVDGWQVTAHRLVPFSLERTLAEWERVRFVERFGMSARLMRDEWQRARLELYPFNKWMQQQHPDERATAAHYTAFQNVDKDAYMPVAYRSENLKYQRLQAVDMSVSKADA